MINHILSLGMDRSWRKRTARLLIRHQTLEGDVLDVCCGTGSLSFAFLKRQQQCKVERTNYGIDFSPEMLDIAQKKAQRHPTLHFSLGDALDLPFEADRFALVAIAFGLRNVHKIHRGLTEIIRVCKPGGTVAILDFSMPTLPILRHCYQFYFRVVLPRFGRWMAKSRAYRYLAESVLQFDRPEQLAERLRQLGISNVRVKPMTFGIVTLVWGQK